jgi:hypothetical protein
MTTKVQRYTIYGFSDIQRDDDGNYCDYRAADKRYRKLEAKARKLQERIDDAEQEIIDIHYSVGNMSGQPPLVKRILQRISTKLEIDNDE